MKRIELFPHQKSCVRQILKEFNSANAVCLSWYTGAGKTNVFSELCRSLTNTVPDIKIGISAYMTTEIKDQISERMEQFGLGGKYHKIISKNKIPTDRNVYIFNPQTIYKYGLPFKLDLLIIDESHAGLGHGTIMLRKIMKRDCAKGAKKLLVSATPWDTLGMEEFKDIPVLKRSLDEGLADGIITDFKFHAEEAKITFKAEDFTRKGDLSRNAAVKNMEILKSTCIGKMKNIISRYDKELGNKVLVICPPGNASEVAFQMREIFGGLCSVQHYNTRKILTSHWHNTDGNLKVFKEDPNVRFLFVVNKCSVGFDMQDLSSVIDLTMSRNIKMLAQRCGRIARKNGTQQKHYFYVYDRSMMKERLEWLIATMIDFTLGAYDGWTTKTVKYRAVKVGRWQLIHPYSTTLAEVITALRADDAIENMRELTWINAAKPPTKWDLKLAMQAIKKYANRTDMWANNPGLYKWFRLNAKSHMDQHFPFLLRQRHWNDKRVIAAMKKCETRMEFKVRFGGAEYWIKENGRDDLREKYLPRSRSTKRWDKKEIQRLVLHLKSWTHIRNYPGARRWMWNNGGELYWKDKFLIGKGKLRGVRHKYRTKKTDMTNKNALSRRYYYKAKKKFAETS